MVGTFYHAPEPGSPPVIEVGDHVDAGDQVGILEAMKLMNAIETDITGEVIEVIVPDGAPVEFGEALLEIRVDE
jgi:acetyl-CoA carboxylase biotin carboxyl carrier protein